MMVESWATESVADCLVPVSVTGKAKIQLRDYKPSGRFPVIDQGQELIAGWTDDENAVIEAPLPLVIFGDHTRVFKFLDMPFARGADGTQLLQPKPDIDSLFFFYACRAIDLPARGYNRHFTLLKEKELSYPVGDGEQKTIAAVLRQTESALTQESALLETLQELKRATMTRLFTRGLRGEAQKETGIGLVPESWEVVQLGSVCTLSTGTTPATKDKHYYEGEIPFIKTADIINNRIGAANTFISQQAVNDYGLKLFPPGTVLMAMYGQGKTRGQVSLLEISAATTQNAAAIQPSSAMDSAFLWHYLMSCYERLRGMGSLGHVSHLNLGYLRDLLIVKPSRDEQRECAEILDALDRKIALHRQKRAVLEALFQSLLHKLMIGEIRVDQLDLSALSEQSASKGVTT
jgi:type I restriction enzyme S subunit